MIKNNVLTHRNKTFLQTVTCKVCPEKLRSWAQIHPNQTIPQQKHSACRLSSHLPAQSIVLPMALVPAHAATHRATPYGPHTRAPRKAPRPRFPRLRADGDGETQHSNFESWALWMGLVESRSSKARHSMQYALECMTLTLTSRIFSTECVDKLKRSDDWEGR